MMFITSDGVIIRTHTAEISTFGRQTQGVRIMRLDEGVKLVSAAKTAHEEEENEEITEKE
jgi:DNA gyrase subunit A